jgi:ParB/RepB/Spo0J family partition protein
MGRNKHDSRFERIPLERIDGQERRFAVAYPSAPDPDLIASIRESGLFLPLILHEFSPGRQRVVAGNRRFRAAALAGLKSVPAHILNSDADDLSLFLLNLRENAATRPFNDLERALALNRLDSEFGLQENDLLQIMPVLGLEPGRRVLDQYLRLAALSADLRSYAVVQGIPIRVSSRMAAWAVEDQQALLGLVQALAPGRNTLNQFLDFLEEIALRDRMEIADVLASKEIREVLEEPKQTSTQRRDMLKQRLFQIRYPQLWEETREISRLLKKVGRPGGASLTPPASLEGKALHVSFCFGSIREFEERMERIACLATSQEVRTVLSMLRQEDEE